MVLVAKMPLCSYYLCVLKYKFDVTLLLGIIVHKKYTVIGLDFESP